MEVKVTVIGDGAIGKTTLIHALEGTPLDWTNVGYGYMCKGPRFGRVLWPIESGFEVDFQFWDTPGQESLRALRILAYPDTEILLVGFDLTRPGSLDNTTEWISEFREENTSCQAVILVGTKYDLVEDSELDHQRFMDVAGEIGACAVVLTSAKTMYGVLEEDGEIPDGEVKIPSLQEEIVRCGELLWNNWLLDDED